LGEGGEPRDFYKNGKRVGQNAWGGWEGGNLQKTGRKKRKQRGSSSEKSGYCKGPTIVKSEKELIGIILIARSSRIVLGRTDLNMWAIEGREPLGTRNSEALSSGGQWGGTKKKRGGGGRPIGVHDALEKQLPIPRVLSSWEGKDQSYDVKAPGREARTGEKSWTGRGH